MVKKFFDYFGLNVPDLAHCFFLFFIEFSYEKLTILLNTRRYMDYIKLAYSTIYWEGYDL